MLSAGVGVTLWWSNKLELTQTHSGPLYKTRNTPHLLSQAALDGRTSASPMCTTVAQCCIRKGVRLKTIAKLVQVSSLWRLLKNRAAKRRKFSCVCILCILYLVFLCLLMNSSTNILLYFEYGNKDSFLCICFLLLIYHWVVEKENQYISLPHNTSQLFVVDLKAVQDKWGYVLPPASPSKHPDKMLKPPQLISKTELGHFM